MKRDEGGVGVVLVLALTAVLGLVAILGVGITGLIVAHRRVAAAADLAALAAATARERGRDPCGAAETVAAQNGGELVGCSLTPEAVLIAVRSEVRGLPGAEVRARARAGP